MLSVKYKIIYIDFYTNHQINLTSENDYYFEISVNQKRNELAFII